MITISKLNLYDEHAAINHVKSLGFKRYAATDGETKTINYILKELDKKNLDAKLESFEWTKTSSKLRKLFFLSIFTVNIIIEILLLYPTFIWIILPLYGLFFLTLIFGGKYAFEYSKIIFLGKKRTSKNVIVTIQAKDLYPKRPVIIFSAHHDSVSSNLPYKVMKPLYLSMVLFLIISLLTNLILSFWSILALFTAIDINIIYVWIRNLSLIIGIILLTEIFINFFRKKTNDSIGSIDNASGVAILLELAKLIKQYPLEKTDVIFLWSGAEEMGIWGTKQYFSKHFEELDYDYDLNNSYNINIDKVGTYIGLIEETGLFKKKKLNDNLNDVLKASDTQQKMVFESPKIVLGTGSDYLIFHTLTKKAEKNGFQVSCFLSNNDSKYVHSKKDIPDLCSADNLNGCIDICYNAIRSLDLRVE